MPTWDGISDKDWDIVQDLAVDVVNARIAGDLEDHEILRLRLLAYLDTLEATYGALPSILHTRANYVHDQGAREELLRRAYELAESRSDWTNALLIAHSLAEVYIEDHQNLDEARRWLDRLRQHLSEANDVGTDYREKYEELIHEFMRIGAPNRE